MTTDGRNLRQIVATTDVHSSFHNATPFLTHLHALRPTSLIVDCGDFFEGSGYYRLGRDTLERELTPIVITIALFVYFTIRAGSNFTDSLSLSSAAGYAGPIGAIDSIVTPASA